MCLQHETIDVEKLLVALKNEQILDNREDDLSLTELEKKCAFFETAGRVCNYFH